MSETKIEILIHLIPYFKSEAEHAFNFIQSCENAMNLAKEEQKDILLAIIKSRISGNASSILMNKAILSWDDLKKELNVLFKERYSNLQLHREMISLKQSYSENVVQFTQRCETLQRRMLQNEKSVTEDKNWDGKSDYIKTNILSAFINGLKENLISYCNNKTPKTLSEASSYAQEEESRVLTLGASSSQKFGKDYSNNRLMKVHFAQIKCFKCNKLGHKANSCTSSVNQNSKTNRSQIKCFSCGKIGHKSNKCFSKNNNNSGKDVDKVTKSLGEINFLNQD